MELDRNLTCSFNNLIIPGPTIFLFEPSSLFVVVFLIYSNQWRAGNNHKHSSLGKATVWGRLLWSTRPITWPKKKGWFPNTLSLESCFLREQKFIKGLFVRSLFPFLKQLKKVYPGELWELKSTHINTRMLGTRAWNLLDWKRRLFPSLNLRTLLFILKSAFSLNIKFRRSPSKWPAKQFFHYKQITSGFTHLAFWLLFQRLKSTGIVKIARLQHQTVISKLSQFHPSLMYVSRAKQWYISTALWKCLHITHKVH